MRFTVQKLKQLIVAQAYPNATALAKKYNYTVREFDPLTDELHGYAWWCMTRHASALWPLMGCFVVYGAFTTYLIWWAFQKTEVQFNRFSKHRPWDWERAQYAYNKRKKAFFDDSYMWQRIPELDKLQAEMLEVKNQRLAEQKASRHH